LSTDPPTVPFLFAYRIPPALCRHGDDVVVELSRRGITALVAEIRCANAELPSR